MHNKRIAGRGPCELTRTARILCTNPTLILTLTLTLSGGLPCGHSVTSSSLTWLIGKLIDLTIGLVFIYTN